MTTPAPNILTFTKQLRSGHIRGELPDPDWYTLVHPGGWSYYYHITDRVITDVDVTDPKKYWTMQQYYDRPFYQNQISWIRNHPDVTSDWEIWIGEHGLRWVDHANFRASELDQLPSKFGEKELEPSLHAEARYWEFLQAHPCHREAPVGASMHVEDVLTWSCTDQMLFNTTSSSFTKEQSQELLNTLRSLPDPELRPDERTKAYARAVRTWLVSAASRQIARDRIETHYGRPSARAFREKERQNELTQLSDPSFRGVSYAIFFLFSSILLFGTPTSYLRRIMDVDRRRFDSGVNQTRWRLFLQGLLKDWTDSNLLATVLIAATVAFIATQNIDNISRILTLVSVLLAIASVLTGQYLTREHQPRMTSNASTGLQYFQNAGSAQLLSVVLSLPLTFLSWSFVTFIGAVIVFSVRGQPGNITWIIVVSTTGVLTLFMLLLGWMFWSIWNPPDATSRSAGSKPKVDSRNRGRHDHESSAGLLPSQVHQYPPITSDQPRRSKVSFGTSNRKPRRDEASDDDGSFEGNGKWENGERFFPSQITQMNNIIAR